MNIKTELGAFFRSFRYAFSGLVYCIRSQRNFRFHLAAAFYVLILMRFYDFDRGERVLIYIVIGLVLAAEAVNTAVEAAVDLSSPKISPNAKIAKDCAAAAVLITAIAAAAAGFVMFWDTKVFSRIADYFSEHTARLVLLALSVPVWFIIIFLPNNKRQGDK
ncbi:MAG: diacylglycerol kinase family protein [Ruminococcus sp.]|nr:diacylglycerol kinase family protein [Ruminococcus sp.]